MFVVEGKIEDGGLIAALRSVSAAEGSGLLAVQGDQDLVSVTFVEGDIVAVDAMNYSMEEALCEVLASRGLLSPKDFSAAVDPAVGTGRLAGDVLLEAELVERGDLLDAVREQIFSQACHLLRWDRGTFSWSEGAESPYQAGVEPLSVAEFLTRAADELGTKSPLESFSVELQGHFQPGEGQDEPKILGRDGAWIEEGESHRWITPTEADVLEGLEASRPASELLMRLGIDGFELRHALRALLERDLIREVQPPLDSDTGKVHDLLGEEASFSDLVPEERGSGPLPVPDRRERSDLDLDRSVLSSSGTFDPLPDQEEGSDPLDSLRERFDRDPGGVGRSTARPETWAQFLSMWAARILAVSLLVLLGFQLVLRAQRHDLMFPFFWQSRSADLLEEKFWHVTASKIDRSLRVHHLLYGRFPDDLEVLVDLELLSAADLYDSQGRWLAYTLSRRGPEDGYRIRPAEGDIPLETGSREGAARGDVLLDPRFPYRQQQSSSSAIRVVD